MLSVVIATHESERELVRTLAALVPGATNGLVREVIVTDGGSADGTIQAADFAGCRVFASKDRLGPRLRQAAAAARAAWLLFLRPGTVLDVTWIDEAASFIGNDPAGAGLRAAVFRPRPGSEIHRPLLVEAVSLLFLALGRRARPRQGLLISKSLYQSLGGHRDDADPESDLLRRLGRRIVMLRSGAGASE